MTLVLGVAVPVLLLVLTFTESWTFGLGLVAYVGVFLWSETAREVGRAGGVFAPRGKCVVLGGGWSWILRRRLFSPPNFIVCERGRSRPGWWHAGTTIREVQETLAQEEGCTLAGHPSILTATLGGWIGSKSHGTGGSLWTPTMGRVVVEEEGGARRTLPSKSHVDIDTMIVREVELFTVPNVVCERRVAYLTSERDAAERLFDTPTHLRAVFVDRYQSLCITWVPTGDAGGVTPGVECPPLWLTMGLPARARRGWNTDRWTRCMTLRDASAFGPEPPFLLATAAIAAHTNFEVCVKETTTPALIWKICSEFETLFRTSHLVGRLELRFGRSIQFLDFDVLRFMGNTDLIIHLIRRIYGPNVSFILHPGKAQVKIPPILFPPVAM